MYACTVLVSDGKGKILVGTIRLFTLMVNPKDYIIKKLRFYFLITII